MITEQDILDSLTTTFRINHLPQDNLPAMAKQIAEALGPRMQAATGVRSRFDKDNPTALVFEVIEPQAKKCCGTPGATDCRDDCETRREYMRRL